MIIIVMFSCAMPIVVPKMEPPTGNVCIEAFRFYCGAIYVLKSELLPPKKYTETSMYVPSRKRIWLEIYVADGRKIILYKIINAKKTPERWEFEKE